MRVLDRIETCFRRSTWIDLRSLGIFRIIYGLATLLILRPTYGWLADVPPTFFSPPFLSLANLFDRLPPGSFFNALDVSVILLSLMLTIGFRTRLATAGLLLAMIIGNSFYFSLGKIDHPILAICVLIVMVFKDWGRHFSLDAKLRKSGISAGPELTDLSLLGVFVAFSFLTAGFGKAVVWLDFDPSTGGFLAWLLIEYYSVGNTDLLATWAVHMPYTGLWEIADIGAVLLELSFFWALLHRRRWLIWVAIWCWFHMINTLILNIAFPPNIIVVLAFVPWSSILNEQHSKKWLIRGSLLVSAVCLFLSILAFEPLRTSISVGMGMGPKGVSLFLLTLIWGSLGVIFIWMLGTPLALGPYSSEGPLEKHGAGSPIRDRLLGTE